MPTQTPCCPWTKLSWFLPLILLAILAGLLLRPAGNALAQPPKTGKGPAQQKEGKETAKVAVGRGGVPYAKRNVNSKGNKMEEPEYNKLTPEERWVLLNKGTEYAFTGKYTDHFVEGTYLCKRCNAPLYKSDDKFHSGCGWPAFDDEIKGSIHRETDADGSRIEITCKNCGGHLGHVFNGEKMTKKDSRHCVNSISIKFVPKGKELPEVITAKKAAENSKSLEPKKASESKSAPETSPSTDPTPGKKP